MANMSIKRAIKFLDGIVTISKQSKILVTDHRINDELFQCVMGVSLIRARDSILSDTIEAIKEYRKYIKEAYTFDLNPKYEHRFDILAQFIHQLEHGEFK